MVHATTNGSSRADPELKEPLRIIRQQRTLKLFGVGFALAAAIATAVAYASLSYSDRNENVPTEAR